jgi:hypothetical protein
VAGGFCACDLASTKTLEEAPRQDQLVGHRATIALTAFRWPICATIEM